MSETRIRPDWTVYSGEVVAFPPRPDAPPPLETAGLVEAGLDAVGQGVAILAADGSLIHANAALRAFASQRDGLALDERGILAADASAQSRLSDALWVALAAATGTVRVLPHPTRIALPRPKGGAPWLVEVRPLAATGAILLVAEPPGQLPSAAELGRVLGLDAPEVALALALAAGDSQAALARRYAITPAVLRHRIGRLRRRTGCRSTLELIGLVLSLRVG